MAAPTRRRSILVGGGIVLLGVLIILGSVGPIIRAEGDFSAMLSWRHTKAPAWLLVAALWLIGAAVAAFGVWVARIGTRAARLAAAGASPGSGSGSSGTRSDPED